MSEKLQTLEESIRENTVKRLKTVEGQVRGVQAMVVEKRQCVDILTQISAAQEGLRTISKIVMRNYLENCATHAIREGDAGVYEELMDAIYKYAR